MQAYVPKAKTTDLFSSRKCLLPLGFLRQQICFLSSILTGRIHLLLVFITLFHYNWKFMVLSTCRCRLLSWAQCSWSWTLLQRAAARGKTGGGNRKRGAVLACSCLPTRSHRTMERFCARATNHKQSLIINSECAPSVCLVAPHSWPQHVSKLQLKSVHHRERANTTDRPRKCE